MNVERSLTEQRDVINLKNKHPRKLLAFSDQHLGRLSVMRCSSAHCTLPCVHARGGHCMCTLMVDTVCARSWLTLRARSWWLLCVRAHCGHR